MIILTCNITNRPTLTFKRHLVQKINTPLFKIPNSEFVYQKQQTIPCSATHTHLGQIRKSPPPRPSG